MVYSKQRRIFKLNLSYHKASFVKVVSGMKYKVKCFKKGGVSMLTQKTIQETDTVAKKQDVLNVLKKIDQKHGKMLSMLAK
jgi:hypothetical protein